MYIYNNFELIIVREKKQVQHNYPTTQVPRAQWDTSIAYLHCLHISIYWSIFDSKCGYQRHIRGFRVDMCL